MNPTVSDTQVIKRVKLEASQEHPPLQYRIMLVDKSLIKEAAAFMDENFLPHNNLMKSLGHIEDDEMDEEDHSFYEEILTAGISLAAILEDDRGNLGSIISCCVLGIEKKEDKDNPMTQEGPSDETSNVICRTLDDVMAKADVFTLYNCDAYVTGYGLATASEFQRRGIGAEMLRARAEVCRLTDTPVSAAVFTGEASQKLAHRCGYETLASLNLTTYRIDGRIAYPHPEWPVIKWMAIRYF